MRGSCSLIGKALRDVDYSRPYPHDYIIDIPEKRVKTVKKREKPIEGCPRRPGIPSFKTRLGKVRYFYLDTGVHLRVFRAEENRFDVSIVKGKRLVWHDGDFRKERGRELLNKIEFLTR